MIINTEFKVQDNQMLKRFSSVLARGSRLTKSEKKNEQTKHVSGSSIFEQIRQQFVQNQR